MTDDLKNAPLATLNEHGNAVGWSDVVYLLADLPPIEDEDLAEEVWEAGSSAYEVNRPHIQRTWSALTRQVHGERPFDDGSPYDDVFSAIFKIAFELGWLAATSPKADAPPTPTAPEQTA